MSMSVHEHGYRAEQSEEDETRNDSQDQTDEKEIDATNSCETSRLQYPTP